MADKQKVLASLKEQIESLESEIQTLKELASKVGEDSTRITSEVEQLESEGNIMKMELEEIKRSGEAWKDLELGVQKQLEELTFNLTKAMNRIKEKLE
mgnify:CR=1 FL=1